MKTYFIIRIETGKLETRFIDNRDSQHGTSFEADAKPFETEDEALDYISENNYVNCFVREYTPVTFNVRKTYANKPFKNIMEEKEVSYERAQEVLRISENLWLKHGGSIISSVHDELVVEEADGSEVITWTIEEN